ncbi:MAG: hypothetical protein R3B47_15120 [Bacteroidia bacterium]
MLATFLVPLAFVGFMALEVAFLTVVEEGEFTVLIPQEKASIFAQEEYKLTNTSDLKFVIVDEPIEDLKKRVGNNPGEIFINPPQEDQISKYAKGKIAFTSSKTVDDRTKSTIKNQIAKRIRSYRLKQEDLSEEKLEKVEFDLSIGTDKVNEAGETKKGFSTCPRGSVWG